MLLRTAVLRFYPFGRASPDCPRERPSELFRWTICPQSQSRISHVKLRTLRLGKTSNHSLHLSQITDMLKAAVRLLYSKERYPFAAAEE